jgi:hypothetical protein
MFLCWPIVFSPYFLYISICFLYHLCTGFICCIYIYMNSIFVYCLVSSEYYYIICHSATCFIVDLQYKY